MKQRQTIFPCCLGEIFVVNLAYRENKSFFILFLILRVAIRLVTWLAPPAWLTASSLEFEDLFEKSSDGLSFKSLHPLEYKRINGIIISTIYSH